MTRRILKRLGDRPVEVVKNSGRAADLLAEASDAVGEGKRHLLLARRKGAFLKSCPCSPGVVGCGYLVIHQVLGCPLDCSYCLLQEYLAGIPVTVFVNLDDLWGELENFAARRRAGIRPRIGTGECGDSLALDSLTGLSADYAEFFRRQPGLLFEWKTKTVEVEELLRVEPRENLIVSWSLNAPSVAAAEEHGAPSVEDRIRAAARVQKRGFSLGFHFDPLVIFPGWEKEYAGVVELLFRMIPREHVRWISLGALRFPSGSRRRMEDRFPGTLLPGGEVVIGPDGKDRYFRPHRARLFRTLVRNIRLRGGTGVPLYLCMETAAVWRDSLKKNPGGKASVERSLSPRNRCASGSAGRPER